MIISEFGYQRTINQVEKVSDLCRQASLKTQNPQVLRDLRGIRNEAEVIKEFLASEVRPEPAPKTKASRNQGLVESPEPNPDDPHAA